MDSGRPMEALEIGHGLSFLPRIKLLLTFFRADPAIKPIDEWKLKRSLKEFLNTSMSVPLSVSEEDINIRRLKDVKKRKRADPVAQGALFIRSLDFLKSCTIKTLQGKDPKTVTENSFLVWRKLLVDKMNGMEFNLEGVKFKLIVAVPKSDDFDGMRKEWDELYAFGTRGNSTASKQLPDTVVLGGLPSRWFAEHRVSSKPSMLVTHSVFSTFGKIRNLHVSKDDNNDEDAGGKIISGLHCKILVQFEKYKDFYNAMKMFCYRSLQKEGSPLIVDYELSWDKNDIFSYGQ